jgi:hypothetical protein
MISWFSRKKTFVVLSTIEEEYITTSVTICEAIWIQKLLARLFSQDLETTLIHYDNQISVNLLEYPIFHDKLKHIEISYHFI